MRRPAQTGARVGQPADAAASPRRRTVTERPRTEGVTAYRQRRETAEDMARGGTGYGRADARRTTPPERPRPADRDADDRTAALRGGRHGGGGRPSVDQPTAPERKAPGGPLAWFSGLTGRGRAAAGASLITVLGILVLAALLVTLLHDDSVKLTSVMVYGQSGYTDEQVISMAGLRIGMPMSAVDVDDIYGNFSVNPDVRLDEAVIDTEQSVRLNVGRRTAKAAVSCTGIILVIDEEGVIMERRSEAPEGGLVIIRGMDVTIGSSGRRIESSKAWQMDAMLQILSALEDHDMIGMTAEMSLLDRFNIYLTTRSGIRVIIGEAVDVDNKMLWAETVLAQLAQDGIRRGVVDVSTGKNAVYAEQ